MPPKIKAKVRPAKPSQPQQKSATTTKRKRSNDAETVPTRPSRPRKAIKLETKECDICAETKTVYRDFPNLPSCDHDSTVCKDCYRKHFQIRIAENKDLGWNACNCPLCGQNITKDAAQGILPRPISKEFDKLITQITQQTAHNFLWCPARGCGHGQTHKLTKAPWVQCSKCKSKICFQHQRLWHEGLTCADYDDMANKDQAAQKDLEFIRTTTKACPFCKRRIKKDGGCNHIICIGCRKQWLWNEVPFDGETTVTEAEILGERGGAPPIVGEHRQNLGQAMQAVNAQIDRDNAARQAAEIAAQIPHGVRRFLPQWLVNVAVRQAELSRQRGQPLFPDRVQRILAAAAAHYSMPRPWPPPNLIDLSDDEPGTVELAAERARRVALGIDEPQQGRPETRLIHQNAPGWEGDLIGINIDNPVDLTTEESLERR